MCLEISFRGFPLLLQQEGLHVQEISVVLQ